MKDIKLTVIGGMDAVQVEGTGECGKRFFVALVHDWKSDNPGLETVGALGFNGVRQVMEAVEKLRKNA